MPVVSLVKRELPESVELGKGAKLVLDHAGGKAILGDHIPPLEHQVGRWAARSLLHPKFSPHTDLLNRIRGLTPRELYLDASLIKSINGSRFGSATVNAKMREGAPVIEVEFDRNTRNAMKSNPMAQIDAHREAARAATNALLTAKRVQREFVNSWTAAHDVLAVLRSAQNHEVIAQYRFPVGTTKPREVEFDLPPRTAEIIGDAVLSRFKALEEIRYVDQSITSIVDALSKLQRHHAEQKKLAVSRARQR